MPTADRGDIYLVQLDPTSGHERLGSRRVLVVSPRAFNEASQIPIVLPIINDKNFAKPLSFAVAVNSIRTEGIVRCDQPRALDLSACEARKVDTLPERLMDEVLAKVVTLFQ